MSQLPLQIATDVEPISLDHSNRYIKETFNMVRTLIKEAEQDSKEVGFDGQILIVCPIVIITPNKN